MRFIYLNKKLFDQCETFILNINYFNFQMKLLMKLEFFS